jgi:hypothetical protein
MKLSRHIALGSAAVIGLMFLAGTGCGPKNEGEKVMMQVMQRDLANAAKERERVEARARCLHDASDEKNEAKRKDAVNNCYKLHSI